MEKSFLCLIGCLATLLLQAQNLVPNPGFEQYMDCPTGIGNGTVECIPWQNGNCATVDYYNRCAEDTEAWVPTNWVGYQEPNSGDGYLGFICKWGTPDWQEFPQVHLTEPCIGGYSYEFQFYISLGDLYCGLQHIGVYFSKDPPDSTYCGPIDVIPQFESNLGYMSDTANWVAIRGCFVAMGGEQWMTIGNYNHQDDTPLDPFCNISPNSYYYLDDVSLTIKEEVDLLDLELGDPVTICDQYEIDPGVSDVNYYWSDGSNESTLLVSESGTYTLTITTPDCSAYAIDSIEVTILGETDGVDIGPDTVTLCEGESYVIELDPDLGDYEWQDGSDDAQYTITTTGNYQVSFDDGCDITTDQVMVTVIPPPQPFTLGPDEILCPGEQISFSFDPVLGDFLWQDNTMSSSYTIATEGTYSLTISNICFEKTDVLEVGELNPPELNLDPDPLILCDGEPITIDLDPDQGDYLWHDGTHSNEYEIGLPGTYFVTVTNECGLDSGSVNVVLVHEPILYLGSDQFLCPSQFPFLIHPVNCQYAMDYIWNDGSTDTTLSVSNPGFYYLTVSNECFTVSDVIEIVIEANLPTVTFPDDQILCPGQTLLLESNIQAGTFLWQDSSTASTYNVQVPGTYFLAITNDCGTGSDTIVVDYITPLTQPELGPDLSICPGEQILLTSGASNVNYLWQDGSTGDSLIVNGPGIYIVQVSDLCTSLADTIVIVTSNSPPQVDLPAFLSLCQGDSVIIDAGISGVSYLWNNGSLNSQLTAFSPGTYSITVSNSCGSDVDSMVVQDNGTVPTVSLGDDLFFCTGESVFLNPVSTGVENWLWQDGSIMPAFLVSIAGQYFVNVSNECGTAHDTLEAILLAATPPLALGADTALCPGFSYSLSIPVNGVDILWSNGYTGPDNLVTSPGLIFAEITNGCGVSADTVIITLLPPAPDLDLGADQSLCVGETIVVDPGLDNVNYLWQDGSTDPDFQSTQEETIILMVSNDCGSDTDTLEIIESTEGPQVDIGQDIMGCVGDTILIHSNISGVDFLWNNGSTDDQLQVVQSGTYTLAVNNLCGSDMDTINVNLSSQVPSASLGQDTSVCEGASLVLSAVVSPGAQIMWQDGSSTSVFNVIAPGEYSLSATNMCGEDSDTLAVTYQYPPATFTLGTDTVLCPGQSITLVVPLTGYDILWHNGSQQSSIIAEQENVYALILSNECGSSADSVEIVIDQHVPDINLDTVYPWCIGDEITLSVAQPFDATYLWSDGSVFSSITISTPGVFSVEVATLCNSAVHQLSVESQEPCTPVVEIHDEIFIPNIFSPNDDGINDVFMLSFGSDVNVLGIRGSIYDRWGNVLFSSEDNPFTWDGRFKDEWMNPGVYVYSIVVHYAINNQERVEQFRGDITLIR